MLEKFLIAHKNYFTIQDLMDEVGHEIEKYKNKKNSEVEIQLLRMFKSDLRNLVKRYQRLEEITSMKRGAD